MPPEPSRLRGLDLLRGIAAYAVVLGHCEPALVVAFGPEISKLTSFGAVSGVEIFFALSGFLIGGILLELEPTARNLRTFVVRRWMRTLPVYYFTLGVCLLLPRLLLESPPTEVWRHLVFLQNVTQGARFLNVSWSLAIEEWFYLLVPVCLFLRMRYLHVMLLLVAAGVAARFLLPVDPRAALVARPDAIAYGCLMAWLARSHRGPSIERNAGWLALAGAAGMIAAFSVIVVLVDSRQYTRQAAASVYTALPFAAAFVIPFFARLSLPGRWLPALAGFGAAVSYSIYLWHNQLVQALSRTGLPPAAGMAHVAAVLVLSTALAYAVHLTIERPIMRRRPPMP